MGRNAPFSSPPMMFPSRRRTSLALNVNPRSLLVRMHYSEAMPSGAWAQGARHATRPQRLHSVRCAPDRSPPRPTMQTTHWSRLCHSADDADNNRAALVMTFDGSHLFLNIKDTMQGVRQGRISKIFCCLLLLASPPRGYLHKDHRDGHRLYGMTYDAMGELVRQGQLPDDPCCAQDSRAHHGHRYIRARAAVREGHGVV